jgi:two-component system, NtrC family, sensor kinase
MLRRGESGQPTKGRRTLGPKARNVATSRASTASDLQKRLDEALQQQTATSEVLGIIRRSPADAQPVFDAIVESATRLCDANISVVYLCDGDRIRIAATRNFTPEATVQINELQQLKRPDRSHLSGRAILDRAIVHVPDVLKDPEYSRELALAGGWRAVLAVPLLRDGKALGALAVARAEPKPFSDRQIQLLQTFADQALIAIGNVRLFEAEQQRTRELSEALEQQTATSEVLKVISSSPGELEPVFQTMLESATRICDANFGVMFGFEDGKFRGVSWVGISSGFVDFVRQARVWGPETGLGRLARTKQTVHVADARADGASSEPNRRVAIEMAGMRTFVTVPLLKEGELIGAMGIFRQEVRPFTAKQIELVSNFAAQAVIAIENTRLLNELRESLQQQTATADVLKVISRSTFDLQTVLNTLTESAARLCEADRGVILQREGDVYCVRANYGFSREAEQYAREHPLRPDRGSTTGRVSLEGRTIHIPDVLADPEYHLTDYQKKFGYRTNLGVPLLREGVVIGVLALTRDEVNPFTDKQIELVTTFADQAVIAIENARLFEQVQARTRDLSESLEQQTATSEVLRTISSSPGELEPVFEAMLENAVRICGAKFGNLWLREGDALRAAAFHGTPQAYVEERRKSPVIRPAPATTLGRALATKQPAQVADVMNEPHYFDVPAGYTNPQYTKLTGARTILSVPMLKDNEAIGAITIYRQEVRPFTDKQIELVQNFAAQAVIAIENARLLNELRTRTNELAQSVGELRALGEVSQAVNSTLELETVLTTIVRRAVELSHTDTGAIYVFDEERKEFRLHATYGMSEAMIAAISDQHIGLGRGNVGAATAQRKPVQVADIRDEQTSPVNEIILREGYRSILVIPLLRPDHIVGALVVRRKTPGEFPQSTIDLLETFADQSVVAIQNARLYQNVEARTRELAKSLEDLRTTQDRLVQTQKLASLGQLTAGIAHEIKNPLNFVNNFSGVSAELIDELQDALKGLPIDQKARADINELTDTLRGNLDKVVQHGKRADSIVKNMLLHSREGSGEHRVVDINALVEESLNLAWHGARAEKQGFNIALERSFDPAVGEADVFPQDITRALLNLISNGFYAATKRKEQADAGNYEPTVAASTKNLGDRVEIDIRDNGTGIPAEVKEKMFNPFFTTKPAGEGTGLGLSISHDIIVKQHGGSIEVDTQPGEFTEIRVILPRAAALLPERS